MNGFAHELRYGLRSLTRTPAFAAAAILTLAIGIGANAAIFSVVNAVLLKPAPFLDPNRLVIFLSTAPTGSTRNASPAKFQHWRGQTRVVQDVAAFRDNIVNFTGSGLPQQLRVGEVSADYFRLLGRPSFAGERFLPRKTSPAETRLSF